MKVKSNLSFASFFFSMVIILVIGLAFLGGIYYIVNVQSRKPDSPFLIGPVTTAPKTLLLSLDQPDKDTLSYSSSTIVSGKTGPARDVLISTDNNDLVIKSKPDGSFSTVLDLNEGVNRLNVVVFDSSGESKSVGRTVYYSKEKL